MRQWRITFYEHDRAPVEKVITGSFCDAWEISLPHPDERENRHILWKHNVKTLFDAGTYIIIVSKDFDEPRGTYTTITRMSLL